MRHKIDGNIVLGNYMAARDILDSYEEITVGEEIFEDDAIWDTLLVTKRRYKHFSIFVILKIGNGEVLEVLSP